MSSCNGKQDDMSALFRGIFPWPFPSIYVNASLLMNIFLCKTIHKSCSTLCCFKWVGYIESPQSTCAAEYMEYKTFYLFFLCVGLCIYKQLHSSFKDILMVCVALSSCTSQAHSIKVGMTITEIIFSNPLSDMFEVVSSHVTCIYVNVLALRTLK